jgi:hypothetical protein
MAGSKYARTYNSFSGIDIVPTFNGHAVGACQGVSYSVSREKAPLYTLGSANPRSFSRGKRGIAGAVVFLLFDRNSLFDAMKDNANYWGNVNEQPVNFANLAADSNKSVADIRAAQSSTGPTVDTDLGVGLELENKEVLTASYYDQLPPFDIKLIAATERGHGAIMEILGVEILNCGSGISVDDITTDESCTWVGVNILPWHSQTYQDPATNSAGTNYKIDGNTVAQ